MTKDDKFNIGLALNKIAMMLSDEDFHKVKDLLKQIEQIVAEQTEPSNSEIPNNCEYEDIFEYCPRCGMRILVSKPKDESQNHSGEATEMVKDEPTISKMEQVEDEPQTEEHCETCRHKDKCEGATYEYKNTEWWCLAYAPIDESQTDRAWK